MNNYNNFGTLDFYSIRISVGGTNNDTVYLYNPYENKTLNKINSSLNIDAVNRLLCCGTCSAKKRILGYSLKEAYAVLYTELTK